MTHPLWTGTDGNGKWWSLRSDSTLWGYSPLGGWSQNTSATQIDAMLWLAVGQGAAAATQATNGYSLAACESGGNPPPPPP